MDLRARITELMPQARSELAELVAIRSVADPRQFPPEECAAAAQWVLEQVRRARLLRRAPGRDRGRQPGRRRVPGLRRPGGPDRAALRPLRRAAAPRRVRLADPAVRAHRGGRPLVRPRRRRLQGQHRHAPRRPAGARRRRAGQPEAGGRGIGGAGHRRSRGVRPEARRPAPRRRDPGLRHRQRRGRVTRPRP